MKHLKSLLLFICSTLMLASAVHAQGAGTQLNTEIVPSNPPTQINVEIVGSSTPSGTNPCTGFSQPAGCQWGGASLPIVDFVKFCRSQAPSICKSGLAEPFIQYPPNTQDGIEYQSGVCACTDHSYPKCGDPLAITPLCW